MLRAVVIATLLGAFALGAQDSAQSAGSAGSTLRDALLVSAVAIHRLDQIALDMLGTQRHVEERIERVVDTLLPKNSRFRSSASPGGVQVSFIYSF